MPDKQTPRVENNWQAFVCTPGETRRRITSVLKHAERKEDESPADFIERTAKSVVLTLMPDRHGSKFPLHSHWHTGEKEFTIITNIPLAGFDNRDIYEAATTMAREMKIRTQVHDEKKVSRDGFSNLMFSVEDVGKALDPLIMGTPPGSLERDSAIEKFWASKDRASQRSASNARSANRTDPPGRGV